VYLYKITCKIKLAQHVDNSSEKILKTVYLRHKTACFSGSETGAKNTTITYLLVAAN
jgi:hypothetical protein